MSSRVVQCAEQNLSSNPVLFCMHEFKLRRMCFGTSLILDVLKGSQYTEAVGFSIIILLICQPNFPNFCTKLGVAPRCYVNFCVYLLRSDCCSTFDIAHVQLQIENSLLVWSARQVLSTTCIDIKKYVGWRSTQIGKI